MLDDRPRPGSLPVGSSLESTPDGLPLSANRAPAEDLKPWVARVFTTDVRLADESSGMDCGFLFDAPAMRMLFEGNWYAVSADGRKTYQREALFFGPQSKRMEVGMTGSFRTLTVVLNPGATHAFGNFPLGATVDRIIPYSAFGYDTERLYARFEKLDDPADWLLEVEQIMREYIVHKGARKPDTLTVAFDMAALADPNMRICDFAEEHGIAQKTVERIVKRDFGMAPKKVLRRARVLDMAAALCGVADEGETEEIALRYFDQSHLSRDFTTFFKMTPAQFAAKQQPLMTLALEVRQARRLELLGRLDPSQKRPWQA